MPKKEEIHLLPFELEKILLGLKKYSSRVVLSGGEPFEYKYLGDLVLLLEKYEFDISVNTFLPKKQDLSKIINKITSIHISIPNILELYDIESRIIEIHKERPTLKIVLNIPFINTNDIKDNINHLYGLCCKINARIQFIKIFDINRKEDNDWEQRWGETFSILNSLKLTFIESTNREVSFFSKDLIQVDFLEIPCVASGHNYESGNCLHDSDISVAPNMSLSICRWTDSSIDITAKNYNVAVAVAEAFDKSCEKCLFGTINNFLYPDPIRNYMALPHYKWPPVLETSLENCNVQLQYSSISYYGKSGYISQLENEFAEYYNMPYAYSVSSGTVAIYLSCIALGLNSNDEIIIPTYTFPTVVTAIMTTGVKIRVCDTDCFTGNINIESFKQCITKNVKAVLITHLWGDCIDIDELNEICSKENIKIIEDCSHAYGTEYKNKKIGTFGDIACFSMQAKKSVFSGEGGMVITRDKGIYETIVMFSSSQRRILDCVFEKDFRKFWETGLGLKLKMHPLGASIALESLHNLSETNKKRNFRAEILNTAISSSSILSAPRHNDPRIKRTYYTYKSLLNNEYISRRDELLEKLILQGLEVTSSSFVPIHKTQLFKNKQILNGNECFKGADIYCNRIISLPAFVNEPEELVKFYAEKLNNTLECILAGD
jgi:dTDP-4-amino-4,6-dideoxygalactose transaminase/organic radical activating enzyme